MYIVCNDIMKELSDLLIIFLMAQIVIMLFLPSNGTAWIITMTLNTYKLSLFIHICPLI